MGVRELFEKHGGEFLKFDRIPARERRHDVRDLCAMLYLCDRFGPVDRAVAAAAHDEFFLGWDAGFLTEADVVYLLRCGVRYSQDSLAMFA